MDTQAKRLPKTVLLITDHDGLYGANRALLDLAEHMKTHTSIKPIVLIQRAGLLSQALTAIGVENHCVLFRKWCFLPGGEKRFAFLRRCADAAMRWRIYRLMKGKGIELVHTNISTTQVGDYLAQKLHVPHVWHVREFVPEAFPYRFNHSPAFVAKCFGRADAVVTISKALQASFQRKYPAANVEMIYDGVNLPYGEKRFQPAPTVRFCCVGRLCPQKNQMRILQALLLLKKAGKPFHMHFYGTGSDRAYEDSLYETVRTGGLSDCVTFHGYSPRVVEELAGYDVGLVMSVYEAFGRTTIEFMNASMPVIGAASGATPELIESGEDGLICPPDDPQALADAMARFIDQPALIERMGQRAHAKAGERFSCERSFEQVCALYARCLAARSTKESGEGNGRR